jgi:hypothetical protein
MSKNINYGSRNAPSAYMANKSRDFHDEYGMLKEGYNTSGGEGMVAVGTTMVTGTVGAGKDGMRGYSEEKTVFGPKDTSEDTTEDTSVEATSATPAQAQQPEIATVSPEQSYKDDFQAQLTEELKAKVPGALADKVTVIEQADAAALLNNDFNLNLAQSGMQPGQAGRRGLSFN